MVASLFSMAETRGSLVFLEWRWGYRPCRCFLVAVVVLSTASWAVFSPAAAVPLPRASRQGSGYDSGNYTIFSYHLPESEDDFADVEDGKNLDDNRNSNFFSNESVPWAQEDAEVTQSPFGPADHVGDGHRNAEVFEDDVDDGGGDDDGGGGGGERGEDEEEEVDEDAAKDVVQKFLEEVERYEKNKANCTAGTSHNLGKGVTKQYGLNRFKAQALVAVNRANFLSRIWKEGNPAILTSEYFFFTQVRSMVEGDPEIFAAGNCYDKEQFKDYYLFCPYAYRTADGTINVKDLSVEYDYLAGNGSEWFETCRLKASYPHNETFGRFGAFHFTSVCACVVLCCAVLCCVVLCCAVLCCVASRCVALCCVL